MLSVLCVILFCVHHQVLPMCIFRSAITDQVHDVVGHLEEQQCFRHGIGDQRVLACGLSASVLVFPGVDPRWSRAEGVCRQLCNYTVSMTH